ncbi:BTA121 domain-containing protein surface lipoprotein [Borrelia venezuelensis]|uniref:BTA121 domain-containing protein surface lipoprotein n=1 Tax=Borrelia venezuelensis TaxID=1653839 RepID=UPI001FF6405E|nr:hypothetical protein [Borrelia venezuelensis]UPA12705.1 hypothetical protein bvRMA01_001040 [Borrelia venezuelensis]
MIKEIYHNVLLLLMLLLVISCNLKSSNKPQGDLHKTSLHKTIHGNNFGIKPKYSLDELLNPSGILSKEQAAVRNIRIIVTNPNIGSSENYRTYTDSEFVVRDTDGVMVKTYDNHDFYKLLSTIFGALKTKTVAGNIAATFNAKVAAHYLLNRWIF